MDSGLRYHPRPPPLRPERRGFTVRTQLSLGPAAGGGGGTARMTGGGASPPHGIRAQRQDPETPLRCARADSLLVVPAATRPAGRSCGRGATCSATGAAGARGCAPLGRRHQSSPSHHDATHVKSPRASLAAIRMNGGAFTGDEPLPSSSPAPPGLTRQSRRLPPRRRRRPARSRPVGRPRGAHRPGARGGGIPPGPDGAAAAAAFCCGGMGCRVRASSAFSSSPGRGIVRPSSRCLQELR